MTDDEKRRRRMKTRWWLLLAALTIVLAIIVVPPLVSIGRYKSRITELVSSSLGRPVRLSSVELRLFPRPEFVLTDLTVEEDPAYGAEPILHASTVTAAIRLLSLWRGRLEISTISVDDASLNLVRTTDGRWNVDPFFRNATARTGGAAAKSVPPIPYLEATNSRVNVKKGLEKLPFSLVNADLSFWQENPGDWRLRVRGQPARTDVNLDLADTGIVRLEASLGHASDVRLMPIHMEMQWREAQLGQLSRLLVGSDPGWRGDLTGQLQLDGTAETAHVTTRLRAANVHRAEFAPADALDFDANCAFVYHYSDRSVEKLACDSPLGDGQIKVAGDLPASVPPRLRVDLLKIPVGATLDILRTLRSGIDPDLEAKGTLSGQLEYNPAPAQTQDRPPAAVRREPSRNRPSKNEVSVPAPLQGSLEMDDFSLSGGGLTPPIQVSKIVWVPQEAAVTARQALAATVSLPGGVPSPIAVVTRLSLDGYQLDAHGPMTLARLRQVAHLAGVADTDALGGVKGASATVELRAEGAWIPSQAVPSLDLDTGEEIARDNTDQLQGTVSLHNATWTSGILANDVEITDATLNLDAGKAEWRPVDFQYGLIKGTADLQTFPECQTDECVPRLELKFSDLDAAALQAALLGAQKHDSAFSSLVARFTQNGSTVWPRLDGTIRADSILLGAARLQNAVIALRILPATVELTSIDAGMLGGQIHATGKIANGDKPAYSIEGSFAKLTGPALCQLLALQCTGGPIEGNGKVELSGFTAAELAASAKGSLHFVWPHGAVNNSLAAMPPEVARFDRWTADGTIGGGAVKLSPIDVQRGAATTKAEATVTFGDPPVVKVVATTEGDAAKD
ncbi:MAG: AsmA family protein [Terracidiphilus sp.]